MAGHEALESHNIGDAVMGKSSPFSIMSLMRGALGGGGGSDSGGGIGDSFNPAKAQASLDKGMETNIYQSQFS